MLILHTQRLVLRTIEPDDAPFYLKLVNTREFIANIGDRGIRTVAAAREAIASGPLAMQAALGHSIYLVALKAGGEPIGMCGLIKREALDGVDLGYAFLPEYFKQGYAREAGLGAVEHARQLGLVRLLAIVAPDNAASIVLLDKLGMQWQSMVYLNPQNPGTWLYSMAI